MRSKQLTLFFAGFMMMGAPVGANPVERACMGSGRDAASPSLCSCIGSVARQTLSYGDQRQAARLFDDPDEAEALRMSDNRRDELFWDRYEAFGSAASRSCG